MIFLTKPLSACFNRISDKDAVFSPARIKMAFAAGVLAYGTAGVCGLKMTHEMTDSNKDWQWADVVSWNAVRRGGPWGAAMVGAGYAGDAAFIFAGFGALYRRKRKKELTQADPVAFPQPNAAKPLFGRDSLDARL